MQKKLDKWISWTQKKKIRNQANKNKKKKQNKNEPTSTNQDKETKEENGAQESSPRPANISNVGKVSWVH